MDVLVTGANGTVGTALREHLGDDPAFEFTWLDAEDHPEYETLIADVTDEAAVRAAVEGQDAVVHLAMSDYLGGAWDRSTAWSGGFANALSDVAHVVDAAAAEDLDSIVYASSNHAVGMYEVANAPEVYGPDHDLLVDHTVPHRPDSRYGVVKAFGESLGRLAAETGGPAFYGLRIGAVRDPEYDHPFGDAERAVAEGEYERGSVEYERDVARLKCLWQSRRDVARLVERCLRDESVTWDVFYGLSDGDRGWLDREHARDVLGYDPGDDASEWDAPPE